ncbi:hypothetical protein HKX17_10275 [Sulfitobacter sp. KE34]|uniref:Uncharacterized protein n=1 Tax=Sulfitobacter faviae TaxID=1775881 RepID=A0AAX3LSM0_9RHOB|nr:MULTISPECIES: hypothetical protein [Sulfitobacter]MDF3350577.1 hypothetical protein [Sulfitobacter sp. KE12]MDF3354220.1 hypothetical protein [Sulfitobacter sp. KE27]MDF3357897.1 hypothetical protein [Sulfitobacter sp. KE33]MDF3359949.1 hypothetical protein [Sulfitobacter sp. Ks41]MDF3365292.1 hypothetical protein [Sulfitobacter sp. Ks34]
MPRRPIFLEKRGYRQRRMMDAVRLLPFLGLMLWMVPLLWPVPAASPDPTAPTIPMSVALRYLFGVWALLILGTWALWRRTRDVASGEDAAQPDGPR